MGAAGARGAQRPGHAVAEQVAGELWYQTMEPSHTPPVSLIPQSPARVRRPQRTRGAARAARRGPDSEAVNQALRALLALGEVVQAKPAPTERRAAKGRSTKRRSLRAA